MTTVKTCERLHFRFLARLAKCLVRFLAVSGLTCRREELTYDASAIPSLPFYLAYLLAI